jgi:hypothetical protein
VVGSKNRRPVFRLFNSERTQSGDIVDKGDLDDKFIHDMCSSIEAPTAVGVSEQLKENSAGWKTKGFVQPIETPQNLLSI